MKGPVPEAFSFRLLFGAKSKGTIAVYQAVARMLRIGANGSLSESLTVYLSIASTFCTEPNWAAQGEANAGSRILPRVKTTSFASNSRPCCHITP